MNIEPGLLSVLEPLGYTEGESQVSKKYAQMKSRMKREALAKINRRANEMSGVLTQHDSDDRGFDTVLTQ